MKIKTYALCFTLCTVAISSVFPNNLYAFTAGPPAYRTGAPVDVGTCNSIGCHNTYALNSGDADFSITGPSVYKPGKSIKLTVSFTNSSGVLHGFEMTALDEGSNRVGKFKKIDKNTQVIPPKDPRGLAEEDRGKYIEHTFKGNKKKKWKVKWKAPEDATGTITFYAAGNEANGNGIATGDYIYTATLEIGAGSSVNSFDFNHGKATTEE